MTQLFLWWKSRYVQRIRSAWPAYLNGKQRKSPSLSVSVLAQRQFEPSISSP